MTACLFALALNSASGQQAPVPEGPVANFGTTVVSSSGLQGDLYFISPDTKKLPAFEKLRPIGRIYADYLNIPQRAFSEGFPGVTERFEWFAIDYRGEFWIEKPGRYWFALISDDGSKLYIDQSLVVDNDGIHPPTAQQGTIQLVAGLHRIRVSYFQGPRIYVALILAIAPPGEKWKVFNTAEYKPPVDSGFWKLQKPGAPKP